MPTKTTEDYIIVLSTLHDEGVPVIPARVAECLGVSAPTVTQGLHRLERDGYIRWSGRKEIELTPQGHALAESLMRRHRLIERWLTDVLGLDWATANEEAHRLEHAISPVVEERLLQVMNYPTSCPHGNPIPGAAPERPPSIRLSEAAPGTRTRLFRISELAESERAQLLFFYEQGLRPGVEIEVASATDEAVEVRVADRSVTLSRAQASSLWVYAPTAEPALLS